MSQDRNRIAGDTPGSRGRVAPKSDARSRSRVTNGHQTFLEGVDERSAVARRFRDVLAEIISDLGGDGLSEGQRQLARRAAMLSVECERLEALAVAGEGFDVETYGQLTDRLGRTFQRIGLKRAARDVTPNLSTYVNLSARPTSHLGSRDLTAGVCQPACQNAAGDGVGSAVAGSVGEVDQP